MILFLKTLHNFKVPLKREGKVHVASLMPDKVADEAHQKVIQELDFQKVCVKHRGF